MTVELLYVPGCPHRNAAFDLVRDVLHSVLEQAGLGVKFTETCISDYEEALRHSFPGSPTLRVNGRDIEDVPAHQLAVGFACRTYLVNGSSYGVPPRKWLEHAVHMASVPRENGQ
jgi:hypothetical protein